MPARRATSDHHEPPSPSRRRALKTAAATGAAALVWTEPTIKGLARRPAYANAGSANPLSIPTPVQLNSLAPVVVVLNSGTAQETSVTITLNAAGFAPQVTFSVTGCACAFSTMPMGVALEFSQGAATTVITQLSATSNAIEFNASPTLDAQTPMLTGGPISLTCT